MVQISKKEKPFLRILLFHPWEKGFERSFHSNVIWLRKNGYRSIAPGTLVDFLSGKEISFPSKAILLTFDDGTLETYQIVFPMMKKYGFQGIAFVITTPRLTNRLGRSWWKEVDQSGWLKIESHSHSHGLIFKSPKVIDFYSGEEGDDSFLIKGMDRRLGAPIYHYGYELIHRRYYPEERLSDVCVDYVAKNGGRKFFEENNWRSELLNLVYQYRRRQKEIGFYEKRHGFITRIGIEINRSKRIIEETIGEGKKALFFAYPWGAHHKELIHQLKKTGYVGAFTSRSGVHHFGDDPFKMKRITIPSGMASKDLANTLR